MKTRRRYTPIRIDFTPFVSVALLLIVFFFWLKLVQRPNYLPYLLPDRGKSECSEPVSVDAHLFLLANNRVGFLTYRPDGSQAELLETGYSVHQIRDQLLSITLNHDYRAIVAISPTSQATFKNIVDVLDELQILGHIQYYLNYDLSSEEKNMLEKYARYKATNSKLARSMNLTLYPPKWIRYYMPGLTRSPLQ
ncbi:biopolymer transporter ExbD [Spirosoma radiotolerans]|uniref:biopolymer transporter ExbD n=1 Tax=Spirosoma radiotolerans TaxID=1379870 RepID=UPI0006270BD2|nr:biopolymer transporter ExbD [Spirosoma radiotolerans]